MDSIAPSPATPTLTDRDIRAIFLGLMLILFLAVIDQTILGPALPTIGRVLGNANLLSWVVTIYLLSSTAVTPLVGKMTDVYGRRGVVAGCVSVFMVGSVGCALAPSMAMLILARAVQGMGGGALISLAQIVIADVVSPRERGKYQAYISGMAAAAGIAGPLLGGAFAQYVSWRMIFWLNVPLSLIALYFCLSTLKRLPVVPRHQHRLDFLGAALLGAGAICLLLVLSWGGHEFPWASAPVLGGAFAAVVLLGLFVWRQRAAAEPLVPLGMLSQPVVRVTSLSLFLLMLSNISVGVYTPLYFELYAGLPASRAGMLLIGLVVCAVTGSYLSAQYMRRTGRYKLPPRIGLMVSALGMLAIAIGLAHLPPVGIAALLGVVGFGMGLSIPMFTVATQNAVPFKDLGIATASLSFFRALGGTLGVSLFGAVILALLPRVPGAQVSLEQVAALATTSGQSAQVAWAFRAFYGGCAVMVIGAWALVQFLPEIPLRTQVAHQSQGE